MPLFEIKNNNSPLGGQLIFAFVPVVWGESHVPSQFLRVHVTFFQYGTDCQQDFTYYCHRILFSVQQFATAYNLPY